MGAGWVAGVTRARAMAARRVGPVRARELAAAATLPDALRELTGTPYRRGLDLAAGAADAQRAVSAALLWQLRVLAGWQPRPGTAAVRLLSAGFEIANTREHLRALSGAPPPPPYRLGALSTAWPRLAATVSASEVRGVLASSAWGDPGADSPAAVVTGMRLSAAARTVANVPEAARWATGEAALLVAREVFLMGRGLAAPAARHAARILGQEALRAPSFGDFRERLPSAARWPLEDAPETERLWRAEARWWPAVEQDGLEMLRRARFDVSPVVGAVTVLSVDAWRVRAGLESAAHGGRALEAFDALMD
ncbi:hypothetical protein H9Y04_15125 [Streptomyces sp. TRM66268-LWL]|uniref:V-type ATPase subunit n=1 Tax=Streptomyces polyasparticus TaxID=2767826 RepID=A0ABR7SEI3_9ACTN|nr:hypothetical protein [Streptomyces polyasparticus]MBC9713901.1 hypothetical protein [Streptomyces polyasparticus]